MPLILANLERRIGTTKVDHCRAGRVEIVVVPAIDIALEIPKSLEKADRRGIADPARCHHRSAIAFDLDRNAGAFDVAERGWVDIGHMRRIAKIVGQMHVIRLDIEPVTEM